MSDTPTRSMPINIIVAHGLEAKPLISLLGLERQKNSSEFVQYSNSSHLCLLVSGMGKEAATSGVAYLAEQQGLDNGEVRAWLNVGIAGHRDAPIGSAWLGNKITDQSTGASAYPSQLIDGFQAGGVVTVDEPETAYPSNAAYEMEASAFFAEASKYSTAELVQVYKVISDNLEHPISEIDLKSVPGLISKQADLLRLLIEKLCAITVQHNSYQKLPDVYYDVSSKMHLTVNQNLQLKRLCQRYKALRKEKELQNIAGSKNIDAKQLLSLLLEGID